MPDPEQGKYMVAEIPYPHTAHHREKKLTSTAFDIEYNRNVSTEGLRKDIISYLGEYRFQIQKYPYELVFDGKKIKDVDDGKTLTGKAENALKKRIDNNQNISRESAELQGLFSLEKQLSVAQQGDQIIWVSPPGPKEDGYGDYGFVYSGQLDSNKLKMTAIRVEKPTLEQFNTFIENVTQEKVDFQIAEDFLAHPFILGNRQPNIDSLLLNTFQFNINEKKQKIFEAAKERLSPYIEEFINMVKFGYPQPELQRMFHALENYSIGLSKEDFVLDNLALYQQIKIPLELFVNQYGYKPPTALGSCGASGEKEKNKFEKSNQLFKSDMLKKILGDDEDEKWDYTFYPDKTCRFCTSHELGPCFICKDCNDKINAGQVLFAKN